jgi:hypothetical protein
MRGTRLRTVVWAFGIGIIALGVAPLAQRATREQRAVVAVFDRDGNPMPGLGPADITVREDGIAREVLRVEPDAAPMQIALLVDTSAGMQVMVRDLRIGIQSFSQALWAKSPDSDVTLMEFGERPNQLSPPTTSQEVLGQGLGRLTEHSGSGAYTLEAIAEASTALKKRGAKRPVIAVFVRESSPEFSEQQYQQVEDMLKSSHAALWALLLQQGPARNGSDAKRNRDVVLGDITTRTGGTREILLDPLGINPQFERLAARLVSQYAVIYARPESLIPPSKLEVTSKRPGARVLSSRWIGQ